jgi:hypothetical protein
MLATSTEFTHVHSRALVACMNADLAIGTQQGLGPKPRNEGFAHSLGVTECALVLMTHKFRPHILQGIIRRCT